MCELLEPFGVQTIVDVRTHPRSNFAPEFNRVVLEKDLPRLGLRYVFLGHYLGGRPSRTDHYDQDGRALYYRMASAPEFQRGIELVEANIEATTMALMCSEGKPDDCHRHLLIGRVLKDRGIAVQHVLPDGSLSDLGFPYETPTLFEHAEDEQWKSVRSVSRKGPLKISSGP
ncbi:MAG: DUF488 family protein [Actinomycetota bacterium]